jgi:hypothetical protein
VKFERVVRAEPEALDPFDDPAEAPATVLRDGKDRPYVVPPEGGKRKAYARTTTFVGCLEDQYTVHLWQQRMTAIGLADRPDLLLSVAACRDDRNALNRIVEQAREAAKANTGAITGTALHALCEQYDLGYEPRIPAAYQADIAAYRAATRMFEMVAIEQFCVLDKWGGVAGTPDRVIRFLDQYYIGDIKTGTIEFGMLKFAMQFAVYAHSKPYDWRRTPGEGVEVTEDFSAGLRGEWPGPVDLSRALLIHLPQGEGRCDVYWVNISEGWEAVKVAAAVRAWRNRKDFLTPFHFEAEKAKWAIRQATTVEEVRALYMDFVKKGHDGELILKDCKSRKWILETPERQKRR